MNHRRTQTSAIPRDVQQLFQHRAHLSLRRPPPVLLHLDAKISSTSEILDQHVPTIVLGVQSERIDVRRDVRVVERAKRSTLSLEEFDRLEPSVRSSRGRARASKREGLHRDVRAVTATRAVRHGARTGAQTLDELVRVPGRGVDERGPDEGVRRRGEAFETRARRRRTETPRRTNRRRWTKTRRHGARARREVGTGRATTKTSNSLPHA